MIENIENHMAHTCKCGSVNFALLKSSAIECNKCGAVLDGVRWWEGGIGAQIARAIKAEDECESLRRKLQEQPTHDPLPVVNRDLVRQAVEMLEYVGGPCTTHRAEKIALIAKLNDALKAEAGSLKAVPAIADPMTLMSDVSIMEAAQGWREFDAPEGCDPFDRAIYGACRAVLNKYRDLLLEAK